MKTLFAIGALAALATSSQAVLIDGFTDGALDSGYVPASSGGYGTQVNASVLSGSRYAVVGTTVDPYAEDVRIRVNTAQKLFMVANGIGVDGEAALQYGTLTYNGDLSTEPVFNFTFAANDLPNEVTVSIGSNPLSQGASRTLTVPTLSAPATFSFDFTGEAALTQLSALTIVFDYAPSGDFAVSRIEAVPEPFTFATLASGVGMLALRRRRKN